jgi:hypothetical protein
MTTFALNLAKQIEAAKDNAELVAKKIIIELFSRVIQKSPVDTGRFRANWNCSIGSPDLSTSKETDNSSRGKPSTDKMEDDVLKFDISDRSVFLTNNLDYAETLEYGRDNGKPGSIQAPQGMVRISIIEMQHNGISFV